jgi:hypothetical protein
MDAVHVWMYACPKHLPSLSQAFFTFFLPVAAALMPSVSG